MLPIRKSSGKRRSKKRTHSPVPTVEEQEQRQSKSPIIYTEEIEVRFYFRFIN